MLLRIGVVSVLAVIGLTACSMLKGAATVVPPTLTPLQQEIESQTAAWQAAEINSYQVDIQYNHPGWHPQLLKLVVMDGEAEITEQGCIPTRTCGVRSVEAADMTVDAVMAFAMARAAGHGQILHIGYNDDYHFARSLETTEGVFILTDFRPLP